MVIKFISVSLDSDSLLSMKEIKYGCQLGIGGPISCVGAELASCRSEVST